MLPCCPRTPKTQAWSRGVLLLFLIFYPLLLLISNNTSVGKASTVHITDFTQIPVWKCGDPGGMETPQACKEREVPSALTVLVALPRAGLYPQGLCHSSVPSAITALELSSSWPKDFRETLKGSRLRAFKNERKYSWRFQQALSQAQSS